MSMEVNWKHFNTWKDLKDFLNKNNISKENIINISFCINYISLLYV